MVSFLLLLKHKDYKSLKCIKKIFYFLYFTVSPALPGTVPATILPPGLNPDFNPMQTTTTTQPPLPPTHANLGSQSAAYLPQFHFAHPDFLNKNPFLPYDLANIRAVTNGRTTMHLQHNTSMTSVPPSEQLNSSRLSPASSRPSSSSPPSSAHSVSIKINTSIEMQSNHGNSSEDSDDEHIDVVKSAFVPILRPNTNNSIVGIPDSTVQDKPIIESNRQRCELKAPSSRKPVHQIAPIGPRSPETKIKSTNTQKTVWRPY